MNCKEIKALMVEAVDGELQSHAALQSHCESCGPCRRDYQELLQVKQWLHAMPRHPAPREVGMAIRVEYSRQSSFSFSDRFWVRMENALRPLAIPAAAGLILAVLCFSVLFNTLWMNPALANSSDDVQLSVRTAPRTRPNNYFPIVADSNSNLPDEPILVETHIDPHGRVYDFKVLSGPDSPYVIQSLEQVLYFTVFDPATSFGRPTGGKAILSFRKVKVLG